MKFSVVIPLYNKERHIKRAINSVLNQTYQKFEIIVVDDGSTDDSISEVKSINDERIRLYTQENSGVSVARNKGIKGANNELIAFLDADDAWKPHFLETIRGLRIRYPQAGIYGTAYEFQILNGKRVQATYNDIPHVGWEGIIDDYFRVSMKKHLICASSVVIPKRIFDAVGYFTPGLQRGEDLDMWIRIALKYEIAFSNNICSVYYQDADNRSCNKEAVYSQSFVSKAEDFYERNVNCKNASLFFEEYMIRIFIDKARYLIRMGKKKEARNLLKKYSYTKYSKKRLKTVYISSFLPNRINDLAFSFWVKLKLLGLTSNFVKI